MFAAAGGSPSAAECKAYLDEACRDDTGLRQRVERLLAAHAFGEGILEVGLDAGAMAVQPAEPRLPSDRLFDKRFKLRQKLGEGGMGEVWVADQIAPVGRRVALKLIRPGLDSTRLLARFEQERQALALMEHPNIAKVLDAGIAKSEGPASGSSGVPYFVMELIKGVSITEYCDKARLDPRQRLELFIQVCHAVQHAHQKGLIHRDLKPTNILVALYDGRPVPKVIDFGVAKATGPRLTEHSIFTEVGALVGTLEYMSPEQAELNNLDIDTRSDIYALGGCAVRTADGNSALSATGVAGGRLHRDAAVHQGGGPAEAEHEAIGLGDFAQCRGRPANGTRAVDRLDSGRAGLDRDQVPGKRTIAAIRIRERAGDGFAPLPRERAGSRRSAVDVGYRVRKFVRRNRGSLVVANALFSAMIVGGGTLLAIRADARRNRVAREARATANVAAEEVHRPRAHRRGLAPRRGPRSNAAVDRRRDRRAEAGRPVRRRRTAPRRCAST